MKTKPMAHQVVGEKRLADMPEYFGLGAEQGTGKTWMLLSDIERQYSSKDITGVLVTAPKGVHTNWVRREIPKHLDIPIRADYYLSGLGVKRKRKLAQLLQPSEELALLAINIDALNTKQGFDLAAAFLKAHRTMMIVDESHTIKSEGSERTRRTITLGERAVSRRIASGTMMGNGPLDLFTQCEFLKPGGKLLGTTSFMAFKSEFAELLPPSHPLVEHIMEQQARRRKRMTKPPQLIAKDRLGNPKWKNLDKLQDMIRPYIFRVLKKDCLDLPDKIYQTAYFELTPKQRKVYEEVRTKMRYERGSGEIDKFTALTKGTKLRQVTSGFILTDGEATLIDEKQNPRLELLADVIESIDGQFIIWAVYRKEIELIAELMKRLNIPHVTYFGDTKDSDREAAIDSFQNGSVRAFIGNAQSGGTGITLTAAQTAIYYSNDYSFIKRSQSEDRNHRIGTESHVIYIDLVAVDTIDERVASALQAKEDVAVAVMDSL